MTMTMAITDDGDNDDDDDDDPELQSWLRHAWNPNPHQKNLEEKSNFRIHLKNLKIAIVPTNPYVDVITIPMQKTAFFTAKIWF